jgi:hypothetical protein
MTGMSRDRLALITAIGATAVLVIPSAEAKFRLSLALAPTRPAAQSLTRVNVRADIALAREHGILLVAVGPWRRNRGQAIFYPRLVRIGPRALRGSIRFPYPGRWHLNIPPSATSGAGIDLWVRVRPRA